MDEHDDVLERAKKLINERKPGASPQKMAAFANSVAYLVTGWAGGYGGPSVRDHAVSHTYGGKRYTFEKAVALLISDEGLIFGPLTEVHRQCWQDEYCFDDDPEDVKQLEGGNNDNNPVILD